MKRNPDIGEERLLEFARRHLSETFPNPKRIGCPSEEELRFMAVQPQKADAAVSEHLTFCSPCFNEYMNWLAGLRQERAGQGRPLWRVMLLWPKSLPARIGAVAVVVLLLSVAGYFVKIQVGAPTIDVPSQTGIGSRPVVFLPFALDLRELSPTRGPKPPTTGPQRQIRVPGSLLDLTLTLPLGSEEQFYRLTLSAGGQVFWSQSTQAHLHDGQILIRTEADFTQVAAGSYNLEVESSAGIRLTQSVLIEAALQKSAEQER